MQLQTVGMVRQLVGNQAVKHLPGGRSKGVGIVVGISTVHVGDEIFGPVTRETNAIHK